MFIQKKINLLIKDDTERIKIKALFEKHYEMFLNIYKNISGLGKVANFFGIPLRVCNDWAIKFGIIDNRFTSRDLELCIEAANFDRDNLWLNNRNQLARFEFFEVLIRIAC